MALSNNWYGSIPDSWTVISFNQSVKRMATGLNPRENFVLSKTDEYYYVTIRNFKDNRLFLDDNCDRISKQAWEIIQARSDLHKGDILFASISKDGQAYLLESEPDNWNINESVFCIRVDETLFNNRYFRYEITNIGFYNDLLLDATGTTFKSIKQNKLRQAKLIKPSLMEQQAIADYLDDRCSKIDEIIAEATASIEEYKELKQAVIFEAVTKGLDKNVPMKDSCVEWIGEMPSHWVVKKFKYVASVNANLVSPDDYMDFQQIAPDCIEKDSGRLIKERTVSEAGVESWNHLFRKGQLIYSKIRPILNKVIIAPYDGLCSADMYPLDVVEDIEFIQKAMLSRYFVDQVGLITQDRVKMPKINKEELANIYMAIPPHEEQTEIVKYLATRMFDIDEVIDEKQALIDDLQAYKKSLIYEVVTGKRRVV